MTPLYLHGLPGSGAELALGPLDMPVLDRAAPSFAQLALRLPDGPLHLVGFSLGAACALRLAVLRPDRVARLTLISAAAPPELADFLPRLAGRAVFRAAHSRARLSALTTVQGSLARLSDTLLVRLMSRGVTADEAALLQSEAVRQSLRSGLTAGRTAYLREMAAYVQPWARFLDHVRCPVTLHHGKADAWAPMDMAETLANRLSPVTFERHAGLGHYGTLQAVLQSWTPS